MDPTEGLEDHLIPYQEVRDAGFERLLLLGRVKEKPPTYRVLEYARQMDLHYIFDGIELGQEITVSDLVKKIHGASSLSHLRYHGEDDWAAVMVKP